MSEADLIGRARRGDEAAWTALVEEHQQPIFRLAYLLLRDADEAEDVAQETFIRAYHALERFDETRLLRPWLLSIAANLSRNRRRSAGRFLAAITRAVRRETDIVATLGERSAEQWEAGVLQQAVERLQHTDREVIYLRYFLDLSEAEIAQTLGVAAGTVKSRLHRAMNRLRTVVEREFPALREERET